MAKKFAPPIRYTSREFSSIKEDLVNYAKRYYPNSLQDFSQNGFGSLMLDSVSYIGDILSFYLDYNINESFLDSALEYNNVMKMARQLGYKFNPSICSFGTATFYVSVPANPSGLGPNTAYIPVLKRGSLFKAKSGATFSLVNDVDFSTSTNQVVVSQVDTTTGSPTYYAIRAYGTVISGELYEQRITIGNFTPFLKVDLSQKGVAEITDVIDSAGNRYYEVENLSQDFVWDAIPNNDTSDKSLVPEILKPISVPRRFTVERRGDLTYLQFGHGSDDELYDLDYLDPNSVFLQMHGRDYITDASFDPSKLLSSDKLGVSPSNTTLIVRYRLVSNSNVNIAEKTLTEVSNASFTFTDPSSLVRTTSNAVAASLEVENEEPIIGDVSLPSVEELRIRAINNYASQSRAVTRQDYIAVVYRMPAKFGAVKRAQIYQDKDSFKRNLNLHLVAENYDGTLVAANDSLKRNVRTWLSRYKMMNDTINIVNANIINLQINFKIMTNTVGSEKYQILERAVAQLRRKMLDILPEIGESFFITDVYSILKDVDGVLDVADVSISSKSGGVYSGYSYDTKQNMSPDGRVLSIPPDSIWEIKYVNDDIVGAVL